MSKASRTFASVSVFAAVVVTAMLLVAGGAIGLDRPSLAGSSGDQYFFGRDAHITTPVRGTVQVYDGDAVITAPVAGDLIVIAGNVTFAGKGRVDGNLIHAGGNVRGEARVGGRSYPLATLEGAAATMTRSAVILSLLLVWFAVAVIVTLLAGKEVRYSSIEVRASAFHCFVLGLVAFTSFVITGIVFSYLVPFLIGVPLLALLAVFAVVTKVYGMIAVFHAAGSLVAAPRTREQLGGRKWFRGDLAMVVTGVVLLGAIHLIPIFGTVVWSCASVFGIGCALATRFGRRDPAFLAWRPLPA